MAEETIKGAAPLDTSSHASKRRKRIANLERQRQRRCLRVKYTFEAIVIAIALYAFTVIERMLG